MIINDNANEYHSNANMFYKESCDLGCVVKVIHDNPWNNWKIKNFTPYKKKQSKLTFTP